MSIDRGMDKDVVYLYNGILFSHKKEWNNAICRNMMDPETVILSEASQTKYYMISVICGIPPKLYRWTYIQNRNKPTDTENKLMTTNGERSGCDKSGIWD